MMNKGMQMIRIVEDDWREIARLAADQEIEEQRMEMAFNRCVTNGIMAAIVLVAIAKVNIVTMDPGAKMILETAFSFAAFVAGHSLWLNFLIHQESAKRIQDLDEQMKAVKE